MRFSIASVAALAISTLAVAATAQNDTASSGNDVHFGICTCFNPKFDASCCILAKGWMMNDGNVCDTLDNVETVAKYRACCERSGGRSKCKYGVRDPSHWPPEDSYGCKQY
ncbi:hypothetical protein DFQ26_006321 [Actinomortierella ambigua]|nr:hypothetical protein DFQ26_006321 [Actinomortierella ambigua]